MKRNEKGKQTSAREDAPIVTPNRVVKDFVVKVGDVCPDATAPQYPRSHPADAASPFGWVEFADRGSTLEILRHSPNMAVHLGIAPQAGKMPLVGRNLLQFYPWSEAELLLREIRTLRLPGEPVALRHRFVRADNSCPEVFSCIFKTVGEGGAEVYISAYEDISRRAAAQEADIAAQGTLFPGKVRIRTFGYFDIFAEGQAVLFRNEKAKELLALLVDRRGGYLTPSEAISTLWENLPADATALARLRKTAMQLRNTLSEHGVEDIVESRSGKRRLNPDKVSCDLFDFLADAPGSREPFSGHYMENYSWGEMTLAMLESKRND